MKKNLLNKFFVFLIFVLFIGSGAFSSGFSIDVFSKSNNTTVSNCETSNEEYDIELVEIVPMYLVTEFMTNYLVFSCTIKNVGTETCAPFYGFQAFAYKVITNKEIDSIVVHTVDHDGLQPGEERRYDDGLQVDRFFPALIHVKFMVYPYDSNTENNDAEAIYLVWGYFFMTPTKFIKIKDI